MSQDGRSKAVMQRRRRQQADAGVVMILVVPLEAFRQPFGGAFRAFRGPSFSGTDTFEPFGDRHVNPETFGERNGGSWPLYR